MSPSYFTALIISIAIFVNAVTGFDVKAARKAISEFNLGVRDGNIDKIDIPAYFRGTDIKVVKSVLDEASAHDGFNLNIWSKGDKLEVVKAIARVINERNPYGQAVGVEDPVKPLDSQNLQNYLKFKGAYYMPIIGYEVLRERLRIQYDLIKLKTANNGSNTFVLFLFPMELSSQSEYRVLKYYFIGKN
ncbi:hypothetical protein DdX_10071 [Ditylenchus destructor]|uniref:Uncharacterized protein n=1 Tax=Ditylenchus destructor TaxID=166010 RepID=A0AAD4N1B9_9BILA|nr:hypothetical protein DdX_10071 [Ditylenchus destructor]